MERIIMQGSVCEEQSEGNHMELTRVNKYLAECGICSRREADRLIEEGRVCINGKKAQTGDKVSQKDCVEVNGRQVRSRDVKAVLAFYKPVGIVCTEKDKHAEKKILDYVKYPVRVTYAGRLDKDSEGLLLLTNDGMLIQRMMKASEFHEKEYIVKVDKELTEEFLDGMKRGVYLPELKKTTRPCEVEALGRYTFRIVLTQGLNRQIRRMCKTFGREIQSLKRIRVMNITLGRLRPGEYREVTGDELYTLYAQAGIGQEGQR